DVNVSEGAPGQMRVVVRKMIYRLDEAQSRQVADQLRLQVEGEGRLRVSTNRQDVERARPDDSFETHLDLTLPPGTSVVVRNEHGSVDVADVAAAEIESAHD